LEDEREVSRSAAARTAHALVRFETASRALSRRARFLTQIAYLADLLPVGANVNKFPLVPMLDRAARPAVDQPHTRIDRAI